MIIFASRAIAHVCLLYFSFFCLNTECFADQKIDANIDMVSSGPFFEVDGMSRARFRVISVLSEVVFSVIVEKLAFGEENCCAKILMQKELDFRDVLIGNVYSVADPEWLGSSELRIKINNSLIYLRNLDSNVAITREKNKILPSENTSSRP